MGKMTTVLQACFIMVLFVTYFFGWPLSPGMGNSMLAVLVSAALISLWQYIDAGITQVRRSKHGR
jgi:phosphatidylglycerophosphate synthase